MELVQQKRFKRDLPSFKRYDAERFQASYANAVQRFQNAVQKADEVHVIGWSRISSIAVETKIISTFIPYSQKKPIDWVGIRRVWAYKYHASIEMFAAYCEQRKQNPDRDFSSIFAEFVNLVAFALYNEDKKLLDAALPYLIAYIERSVKIFDSTWHDFLFAPGLLKLANRLTGAVIPEAIANRYAGVCDVVLAAQNNPAAFGEAMQALCEDYVFRMIPKPSADALEFEGMGYPIPYAAWAFHALNPQVKVDHLLMTWAGDPPPKMTISDYDDELLQTARTRWPHP